MLARSHAGLRLHDSRPGHDCPDAPYRRDRSTAPAQDQRLPVMDGDRCGDRHGDRSAARRWPACSIRAGNSSPSSSSSGVHSSWRGHRQREGEDGPTGAGALDPDPPACASTAIRRRSPMAVPAAAPAAVNGRTVEQARFVARRERPGRCPPHRSDETPHRRLPLRGFARGSRRCRRWGVYLSALSIQLAARLRLFPTSAFSSGRPGGAWRAEVQLVRQRGQESSTAAHGSRRSTGVISTIAPVSILEMSSSDRPGSASCARRARPSRFVRSITCATDSRGAPPSPSSLRLVFFGSQGPARSCTIMLTIPGGLAPGCTLPTRR